VYRRHNAGKNDMAILSGMKKWRQKSSCATIFGNTEVKKNPAAYRASPLPQIALHGYWNSNLRQASYHSQSQPWEQQSCAGLKPSVCLFQTESIKSNKNKTKYESK
jgi:hypothetical protein